MRPAVPILAASLMALACGKGPGSSDAGNGGDGGVLQTAEVEFFSGGSALSAAWTITATFLQATGHATGNSSCQPTVDGCTYCTGTAPGVPGVSFAFESAGTLTFTDGTKQLGTAPFQASVGTYELDSNTDASLSWSAGDMLGVSASGGTVPAFSATVVAPHPITGLTPPLTETSSAHVSESAPFVVAWTPSGDDGSMKLVVGTLSQGEQTVSCTAAESAGMISVPVGILSMLTMGEGSASLSKSVSTMATASSWAVALQAQAPVVGGQIELVP